MASLMSGRLSFRILQQSVKSAHFNRLGLGPVGIAYPLFDSCSMDWSPVPGVKEIHIQNKLQKEDDKPFDINKTVADLLNKVRKGEFDGSQFTNPEKLIHFRAQKLKEKLNKIAPVTPTWTKEELRNIKPSLKIPEGTVDQIALKTVNGLEITFDKLSTLNKETKDANVWINRICFLETVSTVPGWVAAMTRHLSSLLKFRNDHGLVHSLLEESENQRMHLLTILEVKNPSLLFKIGVLGTQVILRPILSIAYFLSPHYVHRMVGYLQDHKVFIYSEVLQEVENGVMQQWKTQEAPRTAKKYWNLGPEATMKDVLLAIRADEAHHRLVNHTMASMKSSDYNPYLEMAYKGLNVVKSSMEKMGTSAGTKSQAAPETKPPMSAQSSSSETKSSASASSERKSVGE